MENKNKIKIEVNGVNYEVEIDNKALLSLIPELNKKTGYERLEKASKFYYVDEYGDIEKTATWNDSYYLNANYYSDKTVAENNARADKLMRQLRRFAVEHREKELDWNDKKQMKYSIGYGSILKLCIADTETIKIFGGIYFDTEETAQLAIDTFKDELLWYFREYKDTRRSLI